MKEFLLIGVGLPRTGTLSVKFALEMILPGKCYHMIDALTFADEWMKILDEKMTDDEFSAHFLTNGYVSAIDAPFSMCYDQALRAFPNAKFLLTVREPEGWVNSIKSTILRTRDLQSAFPLSMFIWLGIGTKYLMWVNFAFSKSLKNQLANEHLEAVENEKGVECFNQWVNEIKSKVPPEKLLIFSVKEGWGPLCKFLDVPTPQEPFPRVNDAHSFKVRTDLSCRRAWLLLYELITIPTLLYGFYLCVRRK